jgi:hypothetical protein
MEVVVTPSKAGQAFVAKGVSALGQCPRALAPLMVAVALVTATVAIRRIEINTPFRLHSPLAIIDPSTDPSMTVVSTMLERGDLWGATARAGSSYRFDKPGDPIAHAEVAWALGRIGGRGSVAPLIAMVSVLDHTVRCTAADALDRTAIRLLQGESAGGA